MVEVLLGLLRADREGDCTLHLACIRRVIPWCFASDKVNYARYLPVYYAQMTQLEQSCPELFQHFQHSHFSVQLNQAIHLAEFQLIKPQKKLSTGKTAGGTAGFSPKPEAVSHYYLTAEHCAFALRQLRETVNLKISTYFNHPDLMYKRMNQI